jgi:hypothetical protein
VCPQQARSSLRGVSVLRSFPPPLGPDYSCPGQCRRRKSAAPRGIPGHQRSKLEANDVPRVPTFPAPTYRCLMTRGELLWSSAGPPAACRSPVPAPRCLGSRRGRRQCRWPEICHPWSGGRRLLRRGATLVRGTGHTRLGSGAPMPGVVFLASLSFKVDPQTLLLGRGCNPIPFTQWDPTQQPWVMI